MTLSITQLWIDVREFSIQHGPVYSEAKVNGWTRASDNPVLVYDLIQTVTTRGLELVPSVAVWWLILSV